MRSVHIRALGLASLATVAMALLAPGARATRLHVPPRFVGMNVGDALFAPGVNAAQQYGAIAASGVGSVRVAFDWATAQPYASWADVPNDQVAQFSPGPVPTDFLASDLSVALAAQRRMTVLPVVLNAPSWDAVPTEQAVAAPADFTPYASYVQELVRRYGPHGTFWSEHPTLPYDPIEEWQVWNEPDLLEFWTITPWVSTYVSLLEQTSGAIKAIDPGAKVVLAGMPDYVWDYLRAIYGVPGARRAFDVVAVHPYTRDAAGVITILSRVRAVMDRHGDRHKPIIATEIGWPSALHMTSQSFDFDTTQEGQASRLAALMPRLARARHTLGLAGFYYYTWMDNEFPDAPAFNFAGLFAYHDQTVTPKPAFAVFRRWALRLTARRP